ncbi:Hypothetical predicted protein [Octopus vulgaris]|uniref:Uncharacterized protein n=1 Tax=Octopus vulgaris TaxID=6645 RepID=A0AA36F1M7_OCTVU|nr:Hypothetical predicted protein [Octopus vulgaris]
MPFHFNSSITAIEITIVVILNITTDNIMILSAIVYDCMAVKFQCLMAVGDDSSRTSSHKSLLTTILFEDYSF